MTASSENRCPRCDAELPDSSADILCPACLLSVALEPSGAQAETLSIVPGGHSSLHVPSEFPYELGDYRLLGLLGRGGMGTVFEAEQRSTGRRLALKALGQPLDTPEMRQRFLREGRLAARINHPNSLFVFGSEEVDGQPVITMEIAGGGTLKDLLKKRGPLPVGEAVDAILDVIAGLERAHDDGILHRDIKPSNCFVAPDGTVKVGDFGLSVSTLAKTDTLVTAHGKIMGTPAYASPEQLRGDELDVRADIYSVGATLYTLLTDRAPFEGDNAVQVVANAVNQKPKPVTDLRSDVPAGLGRVVDRCLAKEPDGRYADYGSLRRALRPYNSKIPAPAPMTVRSAAGWIDYLVAFLPAYVALMFSVGAEALLVGPVVERSLYSARYYLLLMFLGIAYFAVAEGVWGGGLGKWLKGLRVIRADGKTPGLARGLLRILIPLGCVEGVRMPLMMAFITDANWSGADTAFYVIGACIAPWIAVLMVLRARRENGYATVWDAISGTRVVIKPTDTQRPRIAAEPSGGESEGGRAVGPYRFVRELSSGKWLVCTDPVLRRQIWLIRRQTAELTDARRDVARTSRLRWLQSVEMDGDYWDAYEATEGAPFRRLIQQGHGLPWSELRHYLHDLASELWAAAADETLPAALSLDDVWITSDGRAVLLDEPWPDAEAPAERIAASDLAGQQKFLDSVCACVDATSVPLHARPVLRNLAGGKFEKLSFLTGTLRGLLQRPSDVGRGLRAGSIFMFPLYVWIAVFIGLNAQANPPEWYDVLGGVLLTPTILVLAAIAMEQLIALPLRSSSSFAIYRLAVIDVKGARASVGRMLMRWAIVWLPLALPVFVTFLLSEPSGPPARIVGALLLGLWGVAAVYAVARPHRGLHDRLAGTWVVRS